MRHNKECKQSLTIPCIIFLVLVATAACSCGCIKTLQNGVDPKDRTSTLSSSDQDEKIPSSVPNTTRVVPTPVPVAQVTPLKSDIVTEVAPILTPDPYPLLHGTRINDTPQFDFRFREPDFIHTYSMKGNATGLRVNVVEAPLYIVYTVTPQSDCLKDPSSCRGRNSQPAQRPYLKITVRDNQTQEIVAEDGYGREYSSDIGTYEIEITSTQNPDLAETTSKSIPGPRSIRIYKEGSFHITLEGNYLDVNLRIITGASPNPLEVNSNSGTRSQFPEEQSSDSDW